MEGIGTRTRGFSGYLGTLAAALASVSMARVPVGSTRPNGKVEKRSAHRNIGTGAMPIAGGGPRERERHRDQIAAGQITASNGLISWQECAARGWHKLIPPNVTL
jgi:hypothetical protein